MTQILPTRIPAYGFDLTQLQVEVEALEKAEEEARAAAQTFAAKKVKDEALALTHEKKPTGDEDEDLFTKIMKPKGFIRCVGFRCRSVCAIDSSELLGPKN